MRIQHTIWYDTSFARRPINNAIFTCRVSFENPSVVRKRVVQPAPYVQCHVELMIDIFGGEGVKVNDGLLTAWDPSVTPVTSSNTKEFQVLVLLRLTIMLVSVIVSTEQGAVYPDFMYSRSPRE